MYAKHVLMKFDHNQRQVTLGIKVFLGDNFLLRRSSAVL